MLNNAFGLKVSDSVGYILSHEIFAILLFCKFENSDNYRTHKQSNK